MNEQLKPCPFCGHPPIEWTPTGLIKCLYSGCSSNPESYSRQGWNTRADGWISVEASLPELQFESQEDPDEDGYPQFDGMVSQTIEITDGEGFGRGHLRSDGKWICYGAEYDMMIVDPEKVTHWAQLRKLPKDASCGE